MARRRRPIDLTIVARLQADAAFMAGADEGKRNNPTAFARWQDALRLCTGLDALLAAAAPFAEQTVGLQSACHVGICPASECARCGPILNLRDALKPFTPPKEKRRG